jgi:iron(III) transport system substrate-binding protein
MGDYPIAGSVIFARIAIRGVRMESRIAVRLGRAALAAIAFLAGGAWAQPDALAAIDGLPGEARERALAEGARREGDLMVYHSTQSEDLKPVFDAFTRKYGVKVREWRSSSENIVQRVVSEARAGKFEVDFIENNSPEMEALRRENLLRRMDSPHFADMRPGTLGAHRTYATSTMDVFVQAYNTDRVKREELPKSYRDLLNPRWKDRLGIEAEDQAWFGTLLAKLGEADGAKLFRDIVAANGVSARKGHTLLANLVATGEVAFALTVYNYKPAQLKARGAPIDWIVIPPAVAQLHAVAVHAKAQHPFAAALLYDFFLGEGQAILAAGSFVPSSRKVASPLGDLAITPIDSAEAIDNQDAWLKAFQDTFIRRNR